MCVCVCACVYVCVCAFAHVCVCVCVFVCVQAGRRLLGIIITTLHHILTTPTRSVLHAHHPRNTHSLILMYAVPTTLPHPLFHARPHDTHSLTHSFTHSLPTHVSTTLTHSLPTHVSTTLTHSHFIAHRPHKAHSLFHARPHNCGGYAVLDEQLVELQRCLLAGTYKTNKKHVLTCVRECVHVCVRVSVCLCVYVSDGSRLLDCNATSWKWTVKQAARLFLMMCVFCMCVCVCVSVCVYVCVCVCVQECVSVYAYTWWLQIFALQRQILVAIRRH